VPGISVHVVDVTRGVPATGMRVRVYAHRPSGRRSVGEGAVGDDGTVRHPMNAGDGIDAGTYEVELDAGAWYRARGDDVPEPAFLETAVFRFAVADEYEHVHLPIKLSPYGLSVWRGR
jgi:5-hydroxyisourate hydrolase